MPVHALPPTTTIANDFTGAWAIPASGVGVGDYMQTLGYNRFMLNAECNRDTQVFIQFSEDHSTWHTMHDAAITDVIQEHANATIGIVAATITPSGQLRYAHIHNTHASNNVLVSFDGTNWKTIPPGKTLSTPTNAYTYQIKGNAAGTTYEALNDCYLHGCMIKANSNMSKQFKFAGPRYIRVLVQNMDSVNALTANIDISAMEAS